MQIRIALADDAEAAARLIRRSIRLLCTEDHRCDPTVLRKWLANKRPAVFRQWLARPDNFILVATDGDGALVGVGGANRAGEITLNYVAPSARFTGVSTALMAALEERLGKLGLRECRLSSTSTAHGFYLARSYRDTGPPEEFFGGSAALPMAKMLALSGD